MIKNLTFQVFLAGLLGVALGYYFESAAGSPASVEQGIGFLKETFLAILRMLIGPLIFFSLLNGILARQYSKPEKAGWSYHCITFSLLWLRRF